jgi:hypothetical protein
MKSTPPHQLVARVPNVRQIVEVARAEAAD